MSFIAAEQFTKCIVTVLMVVVAGATVPIDRELYFEETISGEGVIKKFNLTCITGSQRPVRLFLHPLPHPHPPA